MKICNLNKCDRRSALRAKFCSRDCAEVSVLSLRERKYLIKHFKTKLEAVNHCRYLRKRGFQFIKKPVNKHRQPYYTTTKIGRWYVIKETR